MTISDNIWQYMTISDNIWQYMTISDYIWQYQTQYIKGKDLQKDPSMHDKLLLFNKFLISPRVTERVVLFVEELSLLKIHYKAKTFFVLNVGFMVFKMTGSSSGLTSFFRFCKIRTVARDMSKKLTWKNIKS